VQAREPDRAAAEVPLGPLRRYTEWSLGGMAAIAGALAVAELVVRDLSLAARLAAGVVLLYVGIELWRLLFAGMAGLDRRPPAVARTAAAGAAGLALWSALGPASEMAMIWALPFGMLASGAAIGVDRRTRSRLIGGACLLCGALGAVAGYVHEGGPEAVGLAIVGAVTVAACAWIILASIWIWDVTLRLDEARSTAAEVAVLRERLRFAGELHDVQGHHLQAIAIKAELARRLVGVDDDAARRHAADAQELARTALGETRALVHGYRRTDLATELENAVGILGAAGVQATVTGSPAEVPAELQPLFGSLIREAATNLLRHSEAERCTIAVAREGDEVLVRVADDGRAREAAGAPRDGSGIAGLRERFTAAGGRVDAAPRPERGFALSGRAPAGTGARS
jgi:two-component system sensor histidine kinase DesK